MRPASSCPVSTPLTGNPISRANVTCDALVVAGQDLDLDTDCGQRLDGGSGIGLRRVHKRGEAGKAQLRLVADDRIGVSRRHGPGSHTQRAIALLTQRLEALQKSLALGIVEWATFAARGCIVDALRDDVLGRTLHHEQPR